MDRTTRLVPSGLNHDKCVHSNPLDSYCHSCEVEANFPHYGRDFDKMIGRLDRLLSEFLAAARDPKLDTIDAQTIKHHADDLIGVGNAALKALERDGFKV